jgi:hypothetical protein
MTADPVCDGVPRWIAVAGALLLFAAWSAASVASVAAASPSPAGGAGSVPEGLQVFLDSDFITPDAPPGGIVQAGFTFWDTRVGDFPNVDGVYVLLKPRTGKAAPSEAKIENDFQGHVLATLEVPQGGPGNLEIGLRIAGKDVPLTVAGVGPPPAAPTRDLLSATIEPLVGDTVVDRAFPLAVDVMPRGLWDLSSLPLPDHVVAVARHPGGPGLSTAELTRPGEPGTPYTGKLTIPETGEVEIAIQVPQPGGGDAEVPGSVIQRTVIEGGRRESAAPAPASAAPAPQTPAAAPADGGIPTVAWVLGIGALVVIGVLLARRALSDL